MARNRFPVSVTLDELDIICDALAAVLDHELIDRRQETEVEALHERLSYTRVRPSAPEGRQRFDE
jgi:hypothetical protein